MSFMSSIYFLSFVSGIYSGFSKFALSMWLKYSGADIIALGYFSLTTLPFGLRAFWTPFLENITVLNKVLPANFGSKKNLLILMDFVIFFMTVGLIFINYNYFIFFLAYLVVYCIFISSRESVAIGYQMEFISKEKIGEVEGYINIFYQSGFWIGGSIIFLLSDYFSWYSLFCSLSFILLLNCVFIFNIHNSKVGESDNVSFSEKFLLPYKDLIIKNQSIILWLVAFSAFFRLQDRLLMGITNYYFIDLGFSKFDMVIGKTVGTFSMILGGVLGSLFIKKFDYKKTLFYSIIFNSLSSALLVFQSVMNIKSYPLFLIINIVDKVTRGFQGGVFFSYQMTFCSKAYMTTQVAILLAFDKLAGSLLGSNMGVVVDYFGWQVFFAFSLLMGIPSIFFMEKLFEKTKK